MIEKLELNHLKTLNALYRFGNLSMAAENVGVSQQAISLQLKTIRAILGDQLFVRTGHGVVATPYAKLIEPHVQKVLACLNAIPLPASVTPENIERTLVISATDYTQRVVVGALLADLRAFAPKVKILVANIEVSSLTKKMHQGEIDLTFTVDGYVPPGLISEPLFIEQYVCVTGNDAIACDGYLPLEQLVEHDFIITNPGVPSVSGSADAWFARQGLRRNVALSAPSFFMAQEYLRKTNMVAFLPSRLMPCAGLFEIPLPKYPPGYQVVAAYHPSAKDNPFMIWLLDRVRSLLA
ncbi:MAG TPA: LysR family transcriptional regulator [Noviherbaspirillum sp.]|nr:LysR family transcriptional regulator [Noviherbaspirillum sp.]